MKIYTAAPGTLSPEKLQQIYEFRYQIYVAELEFQDSHADHERKIVTDAFDPVAYHFYAEEERPSGNAEIVGAGRFNALKDYCDDKTAEVYQLESLTPDYRETCLISSFMMVGPEHRGGTLPMEIAIAQLKAAKKLDADWCLVSCHLERKGFFLRIGFEEFVPECVHPDFGRVALMKLDLRAAMIPDVNAPNPTKAALQKKRASMAAE